MSLDTSAIAGLSLVGNQLCEPGGAIFHAVNPATAEKLEPCFYSASAADIDRAAQLAADAFPVMAGLSGHARAPEVVKACDRVAVSFGHAWIVSRCLHVCLLF